MRFHPLLHAAFVSLLALACGGTAPPPKATPAASAPERRQSDELSRAVQLTVAGDDAAAESELERLAREGSREALPVLGELYLRTGRPDQVLVLLPPAPPGEEKASHVVLRAQARHELGEVEEALGELAALDQLSGVSWLTTLEARVLRGSWLLERGQRGAAEKQLVAVVGAYEGTDYRAAVAADKAKGLAYVGRAAHLLGAFQDANRAYEEAESLAPATVELLLQRAELFLEKYDTGHAREVIEEAGALGPKRPDVLFARAVLELETSMNFALAGELLTAALTHDPRHQKARALLAGIALRDLDFAEAERLLGAGLVQRPGDLDLLSMSAAVRFLAEDEAGFEKHVEHVLALNPTYARVFLVVSEYAEWEHRYADMERLLRRAARLDPDDGAVRGRLGLTLVRAGSDSAGVVELRRAFDLDPYDVRVLNTLELFETILPARYVERQQGAFTFRLPKDDEPWLMRYVPTLLEEGFTSMRDRYDFEPRGSTLIEIYESREHFAVRTSGLPHIGIAGVCFGRKLATVSPRGTPGNLGMTLWHELGHVFHIGLSRSRVPRFLTEGLAEWETAHLGRGWSRELDPALHEAIEQNRLPGLERMNRAFTHAERLEDVAVAYYASGRVAQFLIERHGMHKVRDLLANLGEQGLRPGAYQEVLGEAPADFDAAFLEWAKSRLQRFDGQFIPGPRRLSFEQAEKAGTAPTAGRNARLELARAELETGKAAAAEERLNKLAVEKLDAEVGYWLARLYLATDRPAEGLSLLERVFALGADGAELRLLAGQLHLAQGDQAKAISELERAGALDKTRAEVWALLASLHHELGQTEDELAAVRQWASLSEHDGALHRRLLELLLQAGAVPESEDLTQRAIWADLGSAETHRLAARMYDRLRKPAKADFEWETALLCPAAEQARAETRAEWAASLDRRGQGARAARVRAAGAP